MQSRTLHVTGMECGGCVNKLELALKDIAGVDDVAIALASGEAAVRYDEQCTPPRGLEDAVVAAGFGIDGIAAINGHDSGPNYSG